MKYFGISLKLLAICSLYSPIKQGSISSVMIPKLLKLVSLGSESFFSDENFGERIWGWEISAIRNGFWNQSWKGGVTNGLAALQGTTEEPKTQD